MSTPRAVEIRPLDDPEELHLTVELYRRVFGLTSTDPAIGPRLLTALRHNGGTVIGAWHADTLVGFVYGFIGLDPEERELYHYSQTAAVAPEMQGAGIGRALKLGQRAAVLATGIDRMRWSFDPLRAANARFNLDVLGARGRWLVPNLYGIERMGPDRGLPSDRMIVEWDLTAAAKTDSTVGAPTEEPSAAPSTLPVTEHWPEPGEAATAADRLLVGVPSEPAHDPGIRNAVSAALADALHAGWVATSCARQPSAACYVLAPADRRGSARTRAQPSLDRMAGRITATNSSDSKEKS